MARVETAKGVERLGLKSILDRMLGSWLSFEIDGIGGESSRDRFREVVDPTTGEVVAPSLSIPSTLLSSTASLVEYSPLLS